VVAAESGVRLAHAACRADLVHHSE
jgi:hypothetical protein